MQADQKKKSAEKAQEAALPFEKREELRRNRMQEEERERVKTAHLLAVGRGLGAGAAAGRGLVMSGRGGRGRGIGSAHSIPQPVIQFSEVDTSDASAASDTIPHPPHIDSVNNVESAPPCSMMGDID